MSLLITTEEFEDQERKRLCKVALAVLARRYPGYNWGADGGYTGLIRISEAKLLQWGGDVQAMTIHDRDWATLVEFEALVVKYAGELLERAGQSRTKSDLCPVEKLPEGFNPRFARNMKLSRVKLTGPEGKSVEAMRRQAQEGWTDTPLIIR